MAAKDDDRQQTWKDFHDSVNMTAATLRKWLDSDESKSVGQKSGSNSESAGHASGRRITEILDTKKADLTDDDYDHMHKVVSYIKRHRSQRPKGDIEDTKWRYSLMNWGHDPTNKT